MFFPEPGGRAVISPSDLRAASTCELALLTEMDVRLGRTPRGEVVEDPMLQRAAQLGEEHEQRVLAALEAAHPGRVHRVEVRERSLAGWADAHADTVAALSSDAEVIYQAVLLGDRFLGLADFLVRDEAGRWLVCDTKLARRESVPALLQVAAYADVLAATGAEVAPVARLILGDGDERDVALADVVPVMRARLARLRHVLDTHQDEGGPVAWGDGRWIACLRCETCQEHLEASDDVLLVAGVHTGQRQHLLDAGVATVADLAARTEPVDGLSDERLARVRAQARLQIKAAEDAAAAAADPSSGSGPPFVHHEVHSPDVLATIPAPSPGDIFFDFEGDPMWAEPGSADWGLEYLFGCLEAPVEECGEGRFVPFWAHDRAQERQALIDFIAYVKERRAQWPDLHIYHYADYERSALLRLAARHGVCEEDVDDLLRDGVLVDLYTVVRGAIRVSQRSYSIKKLEPLYMGDRLRNQDGVTGGADSIVVYHEYTSALLDGRDTDARDLIEDIRDYNEYDCLSTLGLRDWLLERAAEHGIVPQPLTEPEVSAHEPHPTEVALRDLLGAVAGHERDDDQWALALMAAAVQYNRREHKPFWWQHFDRLRNPVDEWISGTDVFHVTDAEATTDWSKEGRQRSLRRHVRLTGSFPAGTRVGPGTSLYALYGAPPPAGLEVAGVARGLTGVTVREVEPHDDGAMTLLIEETLKKDVEEYSDLPIALTPGSPPATRSIDEALEELAASVLGACETQGSTDRPVCIPEQPALDLLARRTPRLVGDAPLPALTDAGDSIAVLTEAVRRLDRSYLAVQGPPGTGKTYVGSRVIAALVTEHGWRVGVVAQGHAAIENVLDAVVTAGVDPAWVGKAAKGDSPAWTALARADDLAGFAAAADEAGHGYVIGGTAWDLTNTKRVQRGQLDLVVVDEAGQFALAPTLAASVAADRLLLLGDPQQLPQVSQGSHPDPVHLSALGWLLDGAATIPAELGYFLGVTWRMHPELTQIVSRLSYDGELVAQEEVTTARSLEGVEPGLHLRTVEHQGRTTDSPEEAAAVVDLVRDLAGRTWTAPDEEDAADGRPLRPEDVLVVTAYNHQVGTVRRALAAAGLPEVRVGTVDSFQGQEAPVVILSMSASSTHDISRGVDFLLSRNRLNVSVSRGQHAAFVVMSPRLTEAAPRSTSELVALGAFLGMLEGAVS